jgi:hypothetical protein
MAGTGIVTRTLHSTLPEAVTIDATDLNRPMLDHVSAQLSSPSSVQWFFPINRAPSPRRTGLGHGTAITIQDRLRPGSKPPDSPR